MWCEGGCGVKTDQQGAGDQEHRISRIA
jgi:hypothetical protein